MTEVSHFSYAHNLMAYSLKYFFSKISAYLQHSLIISKLHGSRWEADEEQMPTSAPIYNLCNYLITNRFAKGADGADVLKTFSLQPEAEVQAELGSNPACFAP